MFSIDFTRFLSALLTNALSTSFLTRLRGFFVNIWRAWLWRRMIFPVPVTLNRFAALLTVFLFDFTEVCPP
jgi:hypothetical protein